MRITLRVTAGPHQGQSFGFEGHDTFIVGRSKRAHFQLPVKDKRLSRIHFVIEVNPPECRLMDMGSTNSTYVNDQEVAVVDLKDGDVIRAGDSYFRVVVDAGEAPDQEVPPRTAGAAVEPEPAAPPEEVFATPPAAEDPRPVVAAAPVPAPPREPLPAPLPPPIPVPEVCRVCATPLPERSLAEARPRLPLCPKCQEQVRSQPQPIDGYQIVRPLGKGGMGAVFLALRIRDGALVALKTITPATVATKSQIQLFLREAGILKELVHPHIVAFREMGESGDRLYFAMDYVPGTDAARLAKSEGPLAVGRAVGLVCQLLEALEYAHAKGFVHRDIKPANVLVTQAHGQEVVQLADFGLAKVYQASRLSGLTMMGDIGGTVAFMAPEQITHYREAKPPVDQYAAAATLYNLLTNRFLYDLPGKVHQLLLMVLVEECVPIQARRPEIPEALAAIIHRALAREPAQRFPDVAALRRALTPFAG